jgi:hypothetical protein
VRSFENLLAAVIRLKAVAGGYSWLKSSCHPYPELNFSLKERLNEQEETSIFDCFGS